MLEPRRLTESFSAAPQIAVEDVAAIKAAGFGFIVNNRPDGEAADQPSGAEIEEAALAAGLGYCAIPVDHSGFSVEQVAALSALMVSPRPVLAYCRSGTRSTMLWALASASRGEDPDTLIDQALAAGYDVRALRPAMEQLRGEG
ncbi:TIGR01244 family sulfur transferase [Sandaracinobacter sp. RS1-74]|uniref:TIGR01244 family sulfur transferase n=1 Tax=Sandaracinobacteroides sayramensis TaxID=2913411 RepID=UPI001EDC6951|nr:TIGR01244 family sulfur transferase [Sandaracinobacteroides sayramensis]MCG2841872.1 TIGR01244 family sulfur transferase [Sandaracinobacteroides sayramensis]